MVCVVKNTGELLANMHSVLVKRFLKSLEMEKLTSSLAIHRLLITRQQGTSLCKMTIPLVNTSQHWSDIMIDQPTVSIDIQSAFGGLLADRPCSSITHLMQLIR